MTTSKNQSNYPTDQESQSKANVEGTEDDIFPKQGSPIIIGGGGSVNIHFRETLGHYEPVPANPGSYVKAGDEIDTMYVVDSDNVLIYNLLRYVQGKNCEVKIHTKIGSAADSLIVINSRPASALGVRFEAAEFGPHPTDPVRRPHYNRDRKLTDAIEVTDNGTGQTQMFPLPEGGICTITVVNSLD